MTTATVDAESPPGSWADWWARARVGWIYLKICLQERLVYRGDFALGTLMRFLPIVTQIFLWNAVFNSIGRGAAIQGYQYGDFIAYYLLTMVSRAFSSMPGLASGIARDVRDGGIKKFIVQPVDMIQMLLLSRVAHKLVYYLVAAAPFALVFFLCRGFFPGWPSASTWGAFLLSLVMAFLLGFYLECTIGMTSFWFMEVSSLLFVYMLFSFFFSGHMFPIDMLPAGFRTLVDWMPLPYLAYFPAAVGLGKIQGEALLRGLAAQAAWTLFFMAASSYVYKLGLRRYSGYGG